MIDYNAKYEFVSDGTWFKEGSICVLEDNVIWDIGDIGKYPEKPEEISYERMVTRKEHIYGIFIGVIENYELDEEYQDSEVCCLDEFKIRIKDKK